MRFLPDTEQRAQRDLIAERLLDRPKGRRLMPFLPDTEQRAQRDAIAERLPDRPKGRP